MARPALETAAAIMMAALAAAAVAYVSKQGDDSTRRRVDTAAALTGGDPSRGQAHIRREGCGACHEIPGVNGARGRVGPSLKGVNARVFIAGVVPNTPTNIVQWIRDPRSLSPHTAMPTLGLDEPTARDIAAYLYASPG